MKYSTGTYNSTLSSTTRVTTSAVLQGTHAGASATLKVWGES